MKKISELQVGESVDFFTMLARCENRETGTKKDFVSFIFEDTTGSMDGKFWDMTLEKINPSVQFAPGMLVKVRGTISEWNGKPQVTVSKIRPVCDSDDVNRDEFIQKSPLSYDYMTEFIRNTVETFTSKELKKIALEVLDFYKEKLAYYPASLKVHHNIKSGLLYHTYCMLNIAIRLADFYPINADLLYTGVIIHDLGKIEEIESNEDGMAIDYSTEGKLLGHMITGIKMIHDLGKEHNISKETMVLLEHMIASHHNKPEQGAVKAPMFYEAELLHYIDMIDSRSYMYQSVMERVEPNQFSEKIFFLDNRQIYKPSICT